MTSHCFSICCGSRDGRFYISAPYSERERAHLKAEEARAREIIASAKELAENTPRQLQAAQETELRVRKRYEAELTTVTEVAEALRLLAQAEVDDALARLSAWRAHLAEAKAKGDLTLFLDLLRIARQ